MTFKLPPPPDPKDSRFYQWVTLLWKYLTSIGTTFSGVWTTIQGGTGQSSYAVGDILYADTTTTLAKLPDVASGKPLLSGGVGVAPAWGAAAVGTVTSLTVTGANGIGVSGSPITSSGTIALSLGAITPTSVNAVVLSGTSTPTLAVTGTSSITGANTGDNAANTTYTIGSQTQAYSAKLTAIAGLADAAGWLHNDGAGTFAYSTPTATVAPGLMAFLAAHG